MTDASFVNPVSINSDDESENEYYLKFHNDNDVETEDDEVVIVQDILDLTSDNSENVVNMENEQWMRWVNDVNAIYLNETIMQELANSLWEYRHQTSDESDNSSARSDDETWNSVIDRGILSQIEPLLSIDPSCYHALNHDLSETQVDVRDELRFLGIRISAPQFDKFTGDELNALLRFVIRKMHECDSRDDDRTDAYSLELFQHIHPLMIYQFMDHRSKVHLPSIYDSIISEKKLGSQPRHPYTNSPLTDAEQQNIIRSYYEVAFFFKAVIEID